MTITPEERAKWLNLLADYSIRTEVEHALCRAINTLEAAETRAKQAERERDVLARYIVEITDACTYAAHFYAISEECTDCDENKPYVPCWIEWARQQTREEAKNA